MVRGLALCVFCAVSWNFLHHNMAAPSKNAHDLIMEVNDAILPKEESKDAAAEDKIVKINAKVGVDLFEGDIAMTAEEHDALYGNDIISRKRSVVIDRRSIWRTRVVPYVIEHSADLKKKIEDAMAVIKSKAHCLTFRERLSSDQHYIRFYRGNGCWSSIGKRISTPATDVSLAAACFSQPLLIHEIMHALGFFHEQARHDRNSFITINFENIASGAEYNFQRQKASQAVTHGTPYDYESILHYSRTTFTANGKDTIQAKFDPGKSLGGLKMSDLDILELNELYQCHDKSSSGWSKWTSWTICLLYGSKCNRMRQRYCFSENKMMCPNADEYGVEDQLESCSSCFEPLNGHWNAWGSWSSCTKQCDKGTKTRSRICNNPVPTNGGLPCPGSSSETVDCRIKKCHQQWYDTSFEDGWGMWQQSSTATLRWQRSRGKTNVLNTGPNGDHTTSHGYYAYIKASDYNHDMKANLESPYFSANSGDKCMRFYYNMNGKDMGTLRVMLIYQSGSSMWIWDKTGHQGNYWKEAAANLANSKEPFKIQIHGAIGNGPKSDMAIDDVFIDDGKCTTSKASCSDLRTDCLSWAKTGECIRNPNWMVQNCCASCSHRITSCTADEYGPSACASFVKNSGCTQNAEWMWKNCCKSCKDCLDTNKDCSYWASAGECTKNPSWMNVYCKISCRLCKA